MGAKAPAWLTTLPEDFTKTTFTQTYSTADPTNPAALTDNSGGTASDTIAAIGATYDQAEVRNAVASLAAKITALQKLNNSLIDLLQDCGIGQ